MFLSKKVFTFFFQCAIMYSVKIGNFAKIPLFSSV